MSASPTGQEAAEDATPAPADQDHEIPADPAVGERRLQAPACAVLLLFIAGMAVAASSHWRRGAFIMGAAALAGGIARWMLPTRWAGMLAVRSRWFDVLLMLATGAVIWLVALVVPPQ